MGNEAQKGIATVPDSSPPMTVIIQVPGEVVMYNVSEPELEAIAAGSNSIHLVLLGISFGGLIAFGIALVTIELSTRLLATFAALAGVSVLATTYFGVKTAIDLRACNRRLTQIKRRRLPRNSAG